MLKDKSVVKQSNVLFELISRQFKAFDFQLSALWAVPMHLITTKTMP